MMILVLRRCVISPMTSDCSYPYCQSFYATKCNFIQLYTAFHSL